MRWTIHVTLLLTLLSGSSCGGGDSSSADPGGVVGGGGSGQPMLSGSFSPDERFPGPGTVALAESPIPGPASNLVRVRVGVTQTQDVYGAAFDLLYDPQIAVFVRYDPGSVLGTNAGYQVADDGAGRIVIGASRVGSTPGADVNGTKDLMDLTFRVIRAGTSALAFDHATLYDSQSPPGSIAGIDWHGGHLIAQ